MRHLPLVFALPLLFVILPSCKKDAPAAATASQHVPGTPHTNQVLDAFRKAGLVPEGFAAMKPKPEPATYCEHGKVNGVETTICEYESDQAMKQGEQLVRQDWARVDTHTGVVVSAKRTSLVVVDRERREPSGKTISQMINLFSTL